MVRRPQPRADTPDDHHHLHPLDHLEVGEAEPDSAGAAIHAVTQAGDKNHQQAQGTGPWQHALCQGLSDRRRHGSSQSRIERRCHVQQAALLPL